MMQLLSNPLLAPSGRGISTLVTVVVRQDRTAARPLSGRTYPRLPPDVRAWPGTADR